MALWQVLREHAEMATGNLEVIWKGTIQRTVQEGVGRTWSWSSAFSRAVRRFQLLKDTAKEAFLCHVALCSRCISNDNALRWVLNQLHLEPELDFQQQCPVDLFCTCLVILTHFQFQ